MSKYAVLYINRATGEVESTVARGMDYRAADRLVAQMASSARADCYFVARNENDPPMSSARRSLTAKAGADSHEKGATPVSQNTIETDAKEFGLHVKQGGWRLGLLVARNVEKGMGEGRPPKETVAFATVSEKVSARQFAATSGVSKDTVLRHLAAWNRAAEAGIVPASNTLTPGQEVDLDVKALPSWSDFYVVPVPEARPDRITDEDRHEALTRISAAPVTPIAIAAAIKANPETAKAARDALDEVYESAPKPYADQTRRSTYYEALDLIEEFRRLHRGVDHIVQLVNSGRATITNPDAVLREIGWLRTALGYIEDGVKSDDLAAQVENFLAEVNR